MKDRTLIVIALVLVFVSSVVFVFTKVSGINKLKKINTSTTLLKINPDESLFEDHRKNSTFEGVIEIIKKTQFDTISYSLTVKNNLVRLDPSPSEKNTTESLLFDLNKNTIVALHHDKKMYMIVPVQNNFTTEHENIKINKTHNFKYISGVKCYQWRVKNLTENTEITYWVAGNQFGFYQNFLRLWNKSDKCYKYFLAIPEVYGSIPVQQIERTLLRDTRTTVFINNISSQKVDSSSVRIPDDYTLFTN
jgi:hypothetical protein